MRLPRFALVALAVLGVPATASAQDSGVQVSLNASVGVTDNANSAPDSPDDPAQPAVAEREAGVTFDVSPGFAFNYATPRTSHALQYVFTFGLAPAQSSIANALSYGGQFETSPTTSLALGLTGTHGRTQQVTGAQSAATTPVNVTPATPSYFFRVDATEGFTKALTPDFEIGQGVSAGGFFPLDDATRAPIYTVAGSLNGTTSWRDDSLGLTLSSTYIQFAALAGQPVQPDTPAIADTPLRHELLTTLATTWRRDFTDRWSTQLGIGITHGMDPSSGSGQSWSPNGQAAVLYTREEWQAELSNTIAAQPNILLGEIVLANTAALRLALPLYTGAHNTITTSASGGYQNSRPIDEDGNFGSVTNMFLADAALIWAPTSLPIDYGMALRYQFTRQVPSASPETAFSRHTVLLAITAAFDNRARQTTPLITPPYRPREPESPKPREPEPTPE